ncbi:phosphopyruvate hydratase [Candidatus Woesearchaeota archaeon]|nr:phosphopyruvate hydratase [Candidatus Woesearchaeota archaeon]
MVETIQEVKAIQVLDSRGNPTMKVYVRTESQKGWAIVPSGASTGVHEAIELRDGKKAYGGKGVEKAVDNINKLISKELEGIPITDQVKIDGTMIDLDGTPNKSKLGGNAMIGVSLAAARAGAATKGEELYEYIGDLYGRDPEQKQRYVIPVPLANVINGGKHAGTELKFQEFMLIPRRVSNFAEATQAIAETYHILKSLVAEKYGGSATSVGDEGGFAPPIKSPQEALKLIEEAIHKAGYNRAMTIGMDVAASTFLKDGKYDMGGEPFSSDQMIRYYEQLVEMHNLRSIEDPFGEDDLQAWTKLMERISKKRKVQIVGDDLTVTNEQRVRMAANKNMCNAMILKTNQVGTLTEALAAAKAAHLSGWEIIVSHRSGDTEDPFIADLAVGIGASQIKLGAPCRAERTSKYNRVLEIESRLKKSEYAGKRLKIF